MDGNINRIELRFITTGNREWCGSHNTLLLGQKIQARSPAADTETQRTADVCCALFADLVHSFTGDSWFVDSGGFVFSQEHVNYIRGRPSSAERLITRHFNVASRQRADWSMNIRVARSFYWSGPFMYRGGMCMNDTVWLVGLLTPTGMLLGICDSAYTLVRSAAVFRARRMIDHVSHVRPPRRPVLGVSFLSRRHKSNNLLDLDKSFRLQLNVFVVQLVRHCVGVGSSGGYSHLQEGKLEI